MSALDTSTTNTRDANVERMSKLMTECRGLFNKGDLTESIDLATRMLMQLETLDYMDSVHSKVILNIRSALNGYKGLSLLKQRNYSTATCFLRECERLRIDEKNYDIPETTCAFDECLGNLQAMHVSEKPTKYPRTAHLFDTGGTAITTDDLVLDDLVPVVNFLSKAAQDNVFIEEKIDGANLGFSMCPLTGRIQAQNRSHFISRVEHAQFNRVQEWIAEHEKSLKAILQGGNRFLYGEWAVARHSIPYGKMPGLFVPFDLYDLEQRQFLSRRRFHTIMSGSDIPVVPLVQRGLSSMTTIQNRSESKKRKALREELLSLLETQSRFRNDGGKLEGIILRIDDSENKWLSHKYKVVRPDFVGGCQGAHWSSRPIEKQIVDFEFAQKYLKKCYPLASDREQQKEER